MKFTTGLLAVLILFTSCASKFGKVLKSKDNEYKLKMAEQYYAKKEYFKAQQIYVDIMPYFKGDTRFEDIYYKYSYTAWYQKDYINSENLFKTYVENFPSSTRAEECEYMRCMSFYRQSPKVDLDQTNTLKTIGQMQAFINTHPQSARIKDATAIIDECRKKLELKEEKAARLYYDLGYYKAAAVAFSTLCDNYPDAENADQYKLSEIKAYYKYAEMSITEKQTERYQKVIDACDDFEMRYPDSNLKTDVTGYKTNSQNKINKIANEQTTSSNKQ